MDRIRIVLADDHELIRMALAYLLSDEPDFEIVAQATNGIEAVTLARRLQRGTHPFCRIPAAKRSRPGGMVCHRSLPHGGPGVIRRSAPNS